MNLTTEDKVRDRFVLQDDEKIIAAIESALLGVTPYFEGVLFTKFDRATIEDVFFLNPITAVKSHNMYQLMLSAAFVVDGSISITCADSYLDLFNGPTETVDTSHLIINYESGVVRLPAPYDDCSTRSTRGLGTYGESYPSYLNKHVRVAYTAGFTKVSETPAWLQEAAIAYCGMLMTMHQVDDGKPELVAIIKMLTEHYNKILRAHVRINNLSIRAIK